MQKLKLNDLSALDEIYEITSNIVYILAYSILKSKERAEDIVQDTYIRVYKKIDKYKSGTNAAAWIYKIARNLSYDEYAKKRDTSLDVFEGNMLDERGFDLTESIYLKTVFNTLNADEREVVALFAIGDFKHKEIARIIGRPIGTVQWIYNRAIKKLKERLTRNENAEILAKIDCEEEIFAK